jgi:hypothetical protein
MSQTLNNWRIQLVSIQLVRPITLMMDDVTNIETGLKIRPSRYPDTVNHVGTGPLHRAKRILCLD